MKVPASLWEALPFCYRLFLSLSGTALTGLASLLMAGLLHERPGANSENSEKNNTKQWNIPSDELDPHILAALLAWSATLFNCSFWEFFSPDNLERLRFAILRNICI